jgi:hypothetical protein
LFFLQQTLRESQRIVPTATELMILSTSLAVRSTRVVEDLTLPAPAPAFLSPVRLTLRSSIFRAASMVVLGSGFGRAITKVLIANLSIAESLAILAPLPSLLTRRTRTVIHRIVRALVKFMGPSHRALAFVGTSIVTEGVALVAPAPVGLSARSVVVYRVLATVSRIVRTAGSASIGLGVDEPLAAVAPAPL